jgi:hypothetical protein
LGLRGTRYKGSGEDYVTRCFMLRTPHQILLGEIKKTDMGRVCSTYGGQEWHVQGFGGET